MHGSAEMMQRRLLWLVLAAMLAMGTTACFQCLASRSFLLQVAAFFDSP